MIPVNPHSRTTLVLDRNYQPYAFFTARAAVRHMINRRVKGIDSAGNTVSWDGSDIKEYPGKESTYSWLTGVNLHNDQPCLRSAPDNETGKETQWPVPTIVVCTHHCALFIISTKVFVSIAFKRFHSRLQPRITCIPSPRVVQMIILI